MKDLVIPILIITAILILYSPVVLFVKAQLIEEQSTAIPVILIHGYASGSYVWDEWEKLL